jgi:hypothetical protein
MLKELSSYENLGTPKYFWELTHLLHGENKRWNVDNIRQHFFNRSVEGKTVFDGCLPFAEFAKLILISKDGSVTLSPDFETYLLNEKYLKNKIIQALLETLKDDDMFHEIFCSETLSYDIIHRSIQINNSAFLSKYANFKHLLISFGFLIPHPDTKIRKLIVTSSYKKLFDSHALPEIKKRKIGIEEFEKNLAQKQIYGEEAEDFTLAYEKKRMLKHIKHKMIEKISTYDVSAGYDVISFDSILSTKIDRFIEVKSYSGKPAFYWSRNEIDQARIKRGSYYLYLVNRDEMNTEGYTPLIVQDPYETVYASSDWSKAPSVTYVTKIEATSA